MDETNGESVRREVEGIRDALDALNRRLAALEQRLGTDADQQPSSSPAMPTEPKSTLEHLVSRREAAAETPSPIQPDSPDAEHEAPALQQSSEQLPVQPSEELSEQSTEQPASHTETLSRYASSPATKARTAAAAAPRAPRPRRTIADIEWLVGTKGVALLGVVILVIASAFFLKEAWDRGWIGQIPGWFRCAFAASFGGLLVAAGEVVRRKINPLASSGISAAGIAIVFGSILAATKLYDLLPLPVAFLLLFLTTLTGIMLGALSTRVVLAALSLIGAFLVPVVLSTGEPSLVVMPVYLCSLLVMGLTLAGWKGHAFVAIRRLAWWGTALLGSLWAAGLPGEHAAIPAAMFAGAVWLLTSTELIVSGRFMSRLRGRHPWTGQLASGFRKPGAGEPITFDPRAFLAPEARWINVTFGVTAWAAALAMLSIRRQSPELDWLAPAGLTLAGAVLAVISAPPIAALCRPDATPRSTLAAAFWLNAVAMLGLTIATALHESTQVIAWVAIGLAAVVFGIRARFATSAVIGLGFMAVAAGRLVTYDLFQAYERNSDVLADAFGIVLTSWSLQTMLLAGATTIAAYLLRRSKLGVPVAACAIAFAAISLIGPGSSWLSVGASWAAAGAALIHAGPRIRRKDIAVTGASLIIIATPIIVSIGINRYTSTPGVHDGIGLSWTNASWAFAVLSAGWLIASAARGIDRITRSCTAAVGLLCLAAAGAGDGTPTQTLILYWASILAGAIALSTIKGRKGRPLLRRWLLPQLCIVLASALALLWCATQLTRDWQAITAPPLAHRAVFSSALIIAILAFAGRVCKPPRYLAARANTAARVAAATLRPIAYSAATGLAFAVTSAELVRVIGLTDTPREVAVGPALSVWWSLFAIAIVAVGFRRSLPAARWAGLALLTITAGKGIFMDLAVFDGLTRIAGSTVVGLLMLVVGIVYAKLNASRDKPPQSEDVPSPTPDPSPSNNPGPSTGPGEQTDS